MTRALSTEEPCAIKVARTVLKASGGGDPVAEPDNDIRDYVKRRKISATTRSEAGRKARDTFLSLKKTCQKLGLSFWQYLQDRVSQTNAIPPLPSLIRAAAQGP
jgi:hypothetical protein